jgi:hypothetical protein
MATKMHKKSPTSFEAAKLLAFLMMQLIESHNDD